MGLSSNVLWHQTKKEVLMNILKVKKLYFSYSMENILASDAFKGIAFPMVSLSDLPLSEFGEKKWAYGDYAIGFSRDWAIKKQFNPVVYCHPGSAFLRHMIDELNDAVSSGSNERIEKALFPFSYMKLVEGPLLGKKYTNYRFYDEKEVRLVPSGEQISTYPTFLFDTQYDEYKTLYGNSLLGQIGVDFSYSDIKYIIVGSESNRNMVQNFFNRHSIDYSHISILTKQQVLGDIVGNNHNEELPKLNIEPIKASELALKFGEEYFKNKIKV